MRNAIACGAIMAAIRFDFFSASASDQTSKHACVCARLFFQMSCASCGVVPAVAVASDANAVPPLSSATSCAQLTQLKRAKLLAEPSRFPGLRPRRSSGYRKPDPCNVTVDPVTQSLLNAFTGQSQITEDANGNRQTNVRRTPSLFTANDPRAAEEQKYALGFIDTTASPADLSRTTMGLGGTQKTFGQLCTRSVNLLQPAQRFCRQPSIFTCETASCNAALGVQIGAYDTLPTQSYRDLNAGCTAGLGGGRGPGEKTFEQLCVPVTRFGPQL